MRKSVKFVASCLMTGMLVVAIQTADAGPKGLTIVDVATAVNEEGPYAGQFDILLAAVGAADPVIFEILSGNGQHTVFAPIDQAFIDAGFDEESITTVPVDVLTEILAYHVVRGRRDSESVIGSSQLKTREGSRLQQDSGVLTDTQDREAAIVVLDVQAANGIIHAIDAVVLPFSL